MLLVGVIGPRVPCDEVAVRHIGNDKYTITYRPCETGQHVLVIKWGDKHVPGRPHDLPLFIYTLSVLSCSNQVVTGWFGSRVVSVLDSGAEGPGFKSQPRHCRVTVLGKLFTPIVPRSPSSEIGSGPLKGCGGNCSPGGK